MNAKVSPPMSDDVQTRSIKRKQPVEESSVSTPPRSHTDASFIDISEQLPSKFMFYSYDTLSIRPFKWGELKKVYKAVVSKDFNILAEAVNLTIDRSVFDLTVGDFWFLMYWLRMNSFKKSPFTTPWTCSNESHMQRVKVKELPPESLQQEFISSVGNVNILFVDPEKVGEFVSRVEKEYDVYLYPATVTDMIESSKLLDNDSDPGELWMSKYASHINRQYGATLKDRVQYLEQNDVSTDLRDSVDEFVDIMEHGVIEKVTATCSECGASSEIVVSVDALSFFPSI